MAYRVELDPAAIAEAREAFHWYDDRNSDASSAFQRELDEAIELVSQSPTRWPVLKGLLRRRLFRSFPYALIYSVTDDLIQIIAIAHQHRRPGYWRKR